MFCSSWVNLNNLVNWTFIEKANMDEPQGVDLFVCSFIALQ